MFTRNQFSPVVKREGTEVIFSKEKGKEAKKKISPSATIFFLWFCANVSISRHCTRIYSSKHREGLTQGNCTDECFG